MRLRMSPFVAASFAETRARRSDGIAIAAMMPMIATTISSSIRVKPFWFFFMVLQLFLSWFVLFGLHDEWIRESKNNYCARSLVCHKFFLFNVAPERWL